MPDKGTSSWSRVAVLTCKSFLHSAQFVSLKIAGVKQFLSGEANDWRNRQSTLFWTCSPTLTRHDPVVTSCKLPVQVITPRGQMLASRTDDNWSLTALLGKANDWKNREHVVLDLLPNFKWARSSAYFGEPMVHMTSPQVALNCLINCLPSENSFDNSATQLSFSKNN